jgi:hypothetical protein
MIVRLWWATRGEFVSKLIALGASFASLIGLLIAFLPAAKDWPWWAVLLMAVALIAFAVLVLLEYHARSARRVYAKSDSAGIRDYMHEWMKHGGRVAIWTRDMSWAHNPETQRLLTEKARKNELVLCLPQLNELASELVREGAEACVYGTHLLESASRFTIVFLGRDGSRVAVGRASGDTHVIDEFDAGAHPAFYLASDLVTLVRALQRRQVQ